MAGERTLPGLGLTGFWDEGSNDWKDANDANLRLLSALAQCSVNSATTALPSGTDGDIYIVPSDASSNANAIAIRDNGAWVYVTPNAGFLVWVQDTAKYTKWDDSSWSDLSTGGSSATTIRDFSGTTDTAVLADAGNLITSSGASAAAATIPANADVAFPVGTTLTYVQTGTGALSIAAASGVTVNTPSGFNAAAAEQYAILSLIQVVADTWVLTGNLEASS